MKFSYVPQGVCSRKILFDLNEDGVLEDISFEGGCNGNLQGISALAKGKSADEMIKLLSGISCGSKSTSCPDQLARAISEALTQTKNQSAEKAQ